jgi:phosphatidylserine synthase
MSARGAERDVRGAADRRPDAAGTPAAQPQQVLAPQARQAIPPLPASQPRQPPPPQQARPAATAPRSVLAYAGELPNLCSLAGLLAASLGIFFAVRGTYPAAVVALLWALVFDWSDGRLARRTAARTAGQRAFGMQLDSLVDIVTFCVAPALLLLRLGDFGVWFVPGAFVVLAAGALRLSYFNVFGPIDEHTSRGLSLDNNVLVLGLLFVFEPLLGRAHFVLVLYAVLLALAALNVASFATPKLGGRWYYAVVAYALVLSAVYGWQLR